MSQDVQGMLIQIEATTAQLRRELASADQVVARTTQQIDRNLTTVDSAFDRTAQGAQQAGQLIRGAFAALAGAGLVGSIIKQADAVGQMADRMRAATDDSREYDMVQKRLMQTAQETYRPLQEAQELYIRTADAIKGLGYNTQQTLDITDSFSYLLVTNAASADKASGALDAYSKALNTGKVEADGWTTILAAMPTVVESVAAATGKSASEIRRLGAEGKLALEDLNAGLLDTLQANRQAAADMSVSVSDALVNIGNAAQDYIGRLNETSGATDSLAESLKVIADNIDVVAAAIGGVAAGALAVYTRAAALAAVETAKGIRTAVADRAARIAQADAVLQAAIADQRKAQTATILAQREAEAARGTAVQTQMSIQLAQARQREAAATAAVTAAQTGLRQASTGVLAMLGGPMGIAMLAGSAAAAFLLMRDGSDEAKVSLDDLALSVEEYGRKWAEAGAEQRRAMLVDARQQLGQVQQDLNGAITEIEKAFYDRGPKAGQPFGDVITQLGELRSAAQDGAGVDDIVQSLLDGVPAGDSFRAAVEQAAGRVADHAGKQTALNERISEYTDRVDDNTRAQRENATAAAAAAQAGDKYIAQLQQRLNTLQDKTALDAANRFIAENTGLTDQQIAKIRELAAAQDAQRAADARATAGRKSSKASIDEQLRAIDAVIDRALPERKRLEDLAKAQEDLRKAHAAGKVTAAELEQGLKNLNKQYEDPAIRKAEDAQKKANAELKRQRDALQGVLDRLDPLARATRVYGDEQGMLRAALERGDITLGQYETALAALGKEYQRNSGQMGLWAELTEGALDRIDGAFADMWGSVLSGSKNTLDQLKAAMLQTLAEMAHAAITKPIIMQIGAAMGIGGGAGQAASLLGGSGGSGGGMGWGQILNYGQSAYSAITGVGPAALAGWQSGGLSGALSGVGGYYGNMLGGAASTVGGWFGYGGAAASAAAAQQAGFAAGNSLAVNAGMYASGGAATGAGAGMGGILSSMGGMLSNPVTWIVAGMLASNKLYGQGVRADGSKTADYAKDSSTLGKVAWAPFTAGSYAVEKMDKLIGAVWGDRYAAVLTGSPVFQAITDFIGGGIFGGKWQTKDVGIGLGIEGGALDAQQYEYQKKKGGWFKKDKKRTLWSDLDPETAAALQETFDATTAGVAAIFDALSLSVEEGSLDGLQLARTKISTKGKTEEQIQEAIAEWFGNAAEAMNTELNKVFNTGLDLDLEGMQAFVGNLQAVNEVVRYLNIGMFEASVAGGRMAEHLSQVAGGLEALAASAATYYDQFFTAAEKADDTLDAVTRAFEAADVALAGSRQAYRAMVEDIDRTTEVGRELFATLMRLAGQADAYYDIVEARAAERLAGLLGIVGGAHASLQRSIAAEQKAATAAFNARLASLNDMAATARGNVSVLTAVAGNLDAALKRLRGSSTDAVQALRAQAVATLQGALGIARAGGSLASVAGLQDALDLSAQVDTAVYSSLEDFEREQGRTANLIAELQALNGKQLTAEEKLLASVQGQISAAQAQHDAQMAVLDAQLQAAQAQLDALNGIDNSVQSVAAAVAAMTAAVVAALQGLPKGAGQANTPANNRTLVDSIYQSVLGRGTAGDEAGAAYWVSELQSGRLGYDQIAEAIARAAISNGAESGGSKQSAEQYLKGLGVPGFATGGSHAGGAFVAGEIGPELVVTGPARIHNARQTAAALRGDGNAELVSELRALRQEVARQGGELRSIANNTDDSRRALRQQNEFGVLTRSD